ncbi:DUF4395 domain-containing protein [Streptomyces naphthomycinicus]|uniref:DUF4395 domain-containing protein n=1 Tax=Streptomyces naphthomycinicus TaxID=2872625 RepID=UPI001CEC5D9E|nr:DUF4395 domain-containing protein [Streptomyces sp. TML10]
MDIDARGPRWAAAVTAVVLAVGLSTENPWVLGWQTLVFALGAAGGVNRSPYGWVFRTVLRPRLGPPKEFEPPQPPRFAQTVGLVFAALGLVGFVTGEEWLGLTATGAALAAAFLNAVFGYCLGCEMFLLLRRAAARVE